MVSICRIYKATHIDFSKSPQIAPKWQYFQFSKLPVPANTFVFLLCEIFQNLFHLCFLQPGSELRNYA